MASISDHCPLIPLKCITGACCGWTGCFRVLACCLRSRGVSLALSIAARQGSTFSFAAFALDFFGGVDYHGLSLWLLWAIFPTRLASPSSSRAVPVHPPSSQSFPGARVRNRLSARLASLIRSDGLAESFPMAKSGRKHHELIERLSELSNLLTVRGGASFGYEKGFAGIDVPKDSSAAPRLTPFSDECR